MNRKPPFDPPVLPPDLQEEESDIVQITKLNKDLRIAAQSMSKSGARFTVDAYYQIQKLRIQMQNQVREMERLNEPIDFPQYLANQFVTLESIAKSGLSLFTDTLPTSVWAKSICGIGPVISAGLEAHIDLNRAPTVGHIHSLAGIHPLVIWYGKEGAKKIVDRFVPGPDSTLATMEQMTQMIDYTHRNLYEWLKHLDKKKTGKVVLPTKTNLCKILAMRPWNAKLKTLCWKIGESFTKVINREDGFYGRLYLERKILEWNKNLNGEYADQCDATLENKKIGKDTEAYTWYSGQWRVPEGTEYHGESMEVLQNMLVSPDSTSTKEQNAVNVKMLPPAHIHSRAKRWAVKMFLSHWWYVGYVNKYGKEPKPPYAIAHLEHVHFVPPPNFE